jgi:hypothetical protein
MDLSGSRYSPMLSSGEEHRLKETLVPVNVGECLSYLRIYLLGKVSESRI